MTESTQAIAVRLSRPRASVGRGLLIAVNYVWLPVVLVAAWWLASAGSTSPFVPPLAKIGDTLVRDLADGILLVNTGYSLLNLALGLLGAVVVGVGAGLVLGEWDAAREVLSPFVDFARSVPQSALVPIIIGALGIGPLPKVLAIGLACLWPVLLNTIDGVRAVEPVARSMARIYRIPAPLYFRRVVLMSALPQILAGVRVALGIGVSVMVVVELFASDRGIGFYILNTAATFRFPETWAGTIVVGVIGYLLTVVFAVFERFALRWYYASGAK